MVMGHSLGEYGALVAAGALSFEAALEAVSARGREMASLEIPDHGAMAAVMAPLEEIERIVASVDGYVVIANINSTHQAVIGGATAAVEQAIEAFAGGRAHGHAHPGQPCVPHLDRGAGQRAAPADAVTAASCTRRRCRSWPTSTASSTWQPGLTRSDGCSTSSAARSPRRSSSSRACKTLYEAGARVFVEVGPKRALQGFAEDVLGSEHDDVLTLFTNHPKNGDMPSFNAALCGLYAAGLGYSPPRQRTATAPPRRRPSQAPFRPAPASLAARGSHAC